MDNLIEYELWLDESGSFSHEDLAVKDEKYSLIGGILIEKNEKDKLIYEDYPKGHFPPDVYGHGKEDKRPIYQKAPYYLLLLNKLKKDTGCIEVFFENSKYDPSYSPMYLYLRMLVQGVFALYKYLYWEKNKEKENTVKLKVLYAKKDSMEPKVLEDYKLLFIHEIESKKDYKKIIEKIKNNIEWEMGDANPIHPNANKELLFSDLACYTRYNKKVWCRDKTYKDGELTSYNISLLEAEKYLNREVVSEWLKNEKRDLQSRFCKMVHGLYSIIYDSNANAIRSYSLDDTVGYFSEIMELLSEEESKIPEAIIRYIEMCLDNHLIEQEKNDIVEAVIRALKNICYRNNKTIIKNLISRWTSIEQNTNDYISCVAKLKEMLSFITDTLVKEKEIDAPFDMLIFELHTLIADCYLRSNFNKEAEIEIKWCSDYISSTNPRHNVQPETMFHFFEKQALRYLDKYEYEKSIEAIREAEKLFSPQIEDVFHGEYYGDALCMHILALMPLMRIKEKKIIYEEIIKYSDIALKQYIDYPGELERHLQYRSFAEAENGNAREALNCLIKAKLGSIDMSLNYNDLLTGFIKQLLTNEDSYSIQWYLLYYLVILANVCESKDKDDIKIKNIMMNKLFAQKNLMQQVGVVFKGQKLMSEYKMPNYVHPLETVYWKLAYCLSKYDAKQYAQLIRKLYKSDIITKCKQKDIIRWIPIEADRLLYEMDSSNGIIDEIQYNSFIEIIRNRDKSIVTDLDNKIIETINSGMSEKEILYNLSRLLPY